MKKALIFGTTDFAQVASIYLRDDSEYDVEAFVVNEAYLNASPASVLDKPVIAFERAVDTHPPSEFSMFFGIGFSKVNANRRSVYEACKAAGYPLPSYVHSTVARWSETRFGEACFIFEENVIQPFVSVGNNCVLWSGNHIGHHSRIGDNVFIASHVVVSGRCTIGDNTFVGVNATFRDGITVGANCVIGAGAILLKDAEDGSVYKSTATEAYERRSDQLRNF
jgi:sugar O-acyltransferase (sialic acid O-acetyltransferase NeuD family)